MSFGPLSPLMLTAAAGFLPGASAIPGVGSSLGISSDLQTVLDDFNGLSITTQFQSIVTNATGVLDPAILNSLKTLGASTFPALTNSIPSAYATDLTVIAPGGVFNGGLTGLIESMAVNIMGGGDLTRFAQIYDSATGGAEQANQFINSNINIDSIGNTYNQSTGGMDSVITGSINQMSEAFNVLGEDLQNLGQLINLRDIQYLGNPDNLLRQLLSVGGLTPTVTNLLSFLNVKPYELQRVRGLNVAIADSANKALYEGMTKITGSDLDQIKDVLGVTTSGINTMADLLNPVKIFPNSFTTLTVPTPDGLRAIYIDSDGTVNSDLEVYFMDSEKTISPIDTRTITEARLEMGTEESPFADVGVYTTFKGKNITPVFPSPMIGELQKARTETRS